MSDSWNSEPSGQRATKTNMLRASACAKTAKPHDNDGPSMQTQALEEAETRTSEWTGGQPESRFYWQSIENFSNQKPLQ